jgi:PAS domain S-box-containing protein
MIARSARSRYLLPLTYLLAGVAWVVGSDSLIGHTGVDVRVQLAASAKGVAFVVLCALLLFVVQAWPDPAKRASDSAQERRRRSPWRPLLIFLISAAGVGAGGYTLYRQQVAEVRQRAAQMLADAADLTTRQIELWIADRRSGLEYAGSNALLAQGIDSLIRGREDKPVDSLRAALDLLRFSEEFERVQVFTIDGRPLIDTGGPVAMTTPLQQWVRGAMITGRVVMSDLYVPADAVARRPAIDFVVTVNDRRDARPVAVLVARTDPEHFLLPALQPGRGERLATAYALARRDGDGVALLLTGSAGETEPVVLGHMAVTPAMAAAQVVAGRAGVFEARDHRGVEILATGRPIRATPWYLIGKVERQQVYAPVQRLARVALLFALAGLATAALLVAMWWRSERGKLTERIDAAERRATRLQQHFAIAGRLVHDVVLLLDATDARILEVNDRALEAYGYTRDELLGRSLFDLRPADSEGLAEAGRNFAAIVATGYGNYAVRHARRDGSTFPVEISARTLQVGEHTYVQAIARDVSERVEHEQRVAAISAERDALLERLQLQFDHMAAACVVVSPDYRFAQVNPAFEQMFGLPAERVVGQSIAGVLQLPRFREEAVARLEQLREAPEQTYVGVHENVTALGRAIICRWTAAAMRAADGSVLGFVVMADDITELVRAERALRGSEERYRALTEISPVGIFRTDLGGRVVFVNASACAITGLRHESSLGLGWVNAIHRKDTVAAHAAWTRYVRSGGRLPYAHEFRMVRPDGTVAWVLAQAIGERDAEGRLTGHIGTVTDITAVKSAQFELQQAHDLLEQRVCERTRELAAAKDAAEHSDRVKTAFLSTMSHELRTPLNSVLGFTDVMLQGLPGPLTPEQARQLRIVRDSAAHLRALVEDVLDISRIEAGQVGLDFEDVDLRDVVERRVQSFGNFAARKSVRLVFEAPATFPTLRSDVRRVVQIVGNLVSNAVKFTDAGEVVVALRSLDDRIEISVADTGCGIAAGDLEQVFEPFVRVVRPGGKLRDGTGLGLAISRNLARALGGDVSVESETGRGSRFTFWLPLEGARTQEVAA